MRVPTIRSGCVSGQIRARIRRDEELFLLPRGRSLGSLALAGGGGLLCRTGSRRGRPVRGGLAAARTADFAAALRRHIGVGNAAARAALVAAAGFLVHRRPGAPLGFLRADAAGFVTFLDVLGLTLLLVAVA